MDQQTSEIEDIIISDFQANDLPRTVLAPKGKLIMAEDGSSLTLRLEEGELFEFDRENSEEFRHGSFDILEKYLSIDDELKRYERNIRGDREMSIGMLKDKVREDLRTLAQVELKLDEARQEINPESNEAEMRTTDKIEKYGAKIKSISRNINKHKVEIHKKVALSIACIPFVLIGVPLGSLGQNRKQGIGVAMSLGIYVFYWICLIGGEDFADRGIMEPWLAMWAPNIILTAIGAYLFIHHYGLRKKPGRRIDSEEDG